MISDAKLQLILTLYKNDKLTFEEVKILLQEENSFIGPYISNPYEKIGTGTFVFSGSGDTSKIPENSLLEELSTSEIYRPDMVVPIWKKFESICDEEFVNRIIG
jgi:hypothetical protein